MERYLAVQTVSFLWSALLGLTFGLLHDAEACACKAFQVRSLIRAVWDFVLCAAGLGLFVLLLYVRSGGEVEGYILLGCALGLTLWFVGPSRRMRAVLLPIFKALRRGLARLRRGIAKLFEPPRGN